VRRFAFLFVLVVAMLSAACSGGSSSTPPPPTGGFTAASLKGNYAFSMSGQDANGLFITRVGSFVADGNGHVTAAIEDLDDGGSIATVPFTQGGSYTIQANGRGTLTLNTAVNSGLILSISLSSPAPNAAGLLIQTDLNSTSSGSFAQQNVSSFTQPFAAANYTFDFSGADTIGAPISLVGEIGVNGAGGLGTGVLDRNDGGNATDPSGPLTINAGGNYVPDNNAGNAANFGRGTFSFAGLSFAFYPIDQTHAKFLQIDGSAFTSGDVVQQNGAIPSQNSGFTTAFTFLVAGSALNTGTALTRAMRFTPDGNGHLGTIRIDQNSDGSFFCVDSGDSGCSSQTPSGTYSITGPGGRGTLSISIPGQNATINDVFYVAGPALAFIQDISANVVADGSMLGQVGGLPASGNFIFNLTGQVLPSNGNVGFEEDFVGQYTLSTSVTNNISGTSDFVELGSTSNHIPAFTNVATTGTLKINGDGTGRNAYQLMFAPGGSPAVKINFTAYMGGSPPQLLLIGTDGNRVSIGSASTQATP
jgi:hypothetical protein